MQLGQVAASPFPTPRRCGTWICAREILRVDFGFYLDQLSMVMLLVVTGVGFLIHIYSVGYMAHEGGYYRFFAYLNLFMFFMLTLVLADNYLLMFVGWEGVGLALSADRLLLPQEFGGGRRQESVHRQPHRRLRLPASAMFLHHQALRHARFRHGVQQRCAAVA